MLWLLSILLFAVSVALLRHIMRLRRLLREMDAAVRSERRLLPEDSAETLQKIGAFGLVNSLNALMDAHKAASAQTEGYSSQVEAMLGAVQEVVIVYREDRVIEYANRAAETLFRDGRAIKGLRLEGVLRSLTLLELLEAATKAERTEASQIRIEHDSGTLWFEASCAKVKAVGAHV